MPSSRPSSTTGRWWNPRWVISTSTSKASVSGETATGSGVITDATGSLAPRRCATTLARRSRSVRMPVSAPSRVTSSAETPRCVISSAAAATSASGPMVIGACRRMSRTRVRRIAEPASAARTDAIAARILPACWLR